MDPSPDTDSQSASPQNGDSNHVDNGIPRNWHEALLSLLATRVSLIQLESKDAAKIAGRKAAQIIAAMVCVFFTWVLLLAGGIAALSAATTCPWWWIALAASFLHLAAAIGLARAAKRKESQTFPATRAEFQKDREWIKQIKTTPKSSS